MAITKTDSAGQSAAAEVVQSATGALNLQDLKSEFEKFKTARQAFEADWFLNLAFYVGHQWLYWNHGRLDRPNLASWREMAVDNRILPIVTARVAKKVKTRPTFVATPFTGAESDVDAARITEKVMDFDWEYLELEQKLYQAELFADICGAGFWKIYWDSTLGESAECICGPDGEPIQNEGGQIVKAEEVEAMFGGMLPDGYTIKRVAAGDACVDVVSPFHFYPDPLATSLPEVEKAFEENVRSPQYLKQRYGVELEPDADAPSGPVEARLFSTLMPANGVGYTGVKVYEFWAKPCPQYPNGKRVVWAQDQILAEEDNPVDPMPYVMFSGVKVPNRFWPTAVVTQLRGPQTNLNKLSSQILENAKRVGNPALLKSRQANVSYSGVPGEEVLFDATLPESAPSYLQPPTVPQYVLEERSRILESMTEISGLHEVSNARVPSGVTAASAINLLMEADDTRIGPEVQDMEVALGRAGTKLMRLRASFTTDTRLMRIAGDDEAWDIVEFKGTMMGKEPTVNCQAGSAMPRSKAAQQAAILEVLQTMLQYGVVPSERDLRKTFKAYEVGGLEYVFNTLTSTEAQVQRENRLLSQGEPVSINAYDENQAHIEGHEEFQRTARYQQLSPQEQQNVELHVAAHREVIVQQGNMQTQALMQGQQEQELQQADLEVQAAHAMPQPGSTNI